MRESRRGCKGGWEQLDGHGAVQPYVPCQAHDGHTASPELPFDREPAGRNTAKVVEDVGVQRVAGVASAAPRGSRQELAEVAGRGERRLDLRAELVVPTRTEQEAASVGLGGLQRLLKDSLEAGG